MKLTPIQRNTLDIIKEKSMNNNQFHIINRYNENTTNALERRKLIEIKREPNGLGVYFRITKLGMEVLKHSMDEYLAEKIKQINL
jgi:hypothetical protein